MTTQTTTTLKAELLSSQWLIAFNNLFIREGRTLWSAYRWLWKGMAWLTVINFPLWVSLSGANATPMSESDRSLWVATIGIHDFYWIAFFAAIIAAIAIGQQGVMAEKESGITTWILSLPVPHSSYLLSKLVASLVDVCATVLLIPGIMAFCLISVYAKTWQDAPLFLSGIGLLAVYSLFYLSTILLLNLWLQKRSLILGVIAVTTVGQFFLFSSNQWLANLAPWRLIQMAASIHTDEKTFSPLPLVTAIGAALIFVCLSIWRFKQEEL